MKVFHSYFLLFFSIFLLITCIEPVAPEFQLEEGLITVEAIISTTEGGSFATIEESIIDPYRYVPQNIIVSGAEVSFINTNTGEIVRLTEDEETYIPPLGFSATVGDTWELDVKLTDGRNYKSLPETIPESVAITNITASYDPNLVYSDDENEYAPGHSIMVDFNDPPDRNNYYYWNFRSFESRTICGTCFNSYYRQGACCFRDPPPSEIPPEFYHTYECDADCWRIRYNQNIKIYDDEFTNGSTINQLPIADVLLYNKKEI